jgi:hypothetical protein
MDHSRKIKQNFDSGLVKPSDSYQAILGPSYKSGLPSEKEWLDFISGIENSGTREFAQVWREKSKAVNGVPLRRNFDFKTLVKYGQNLVICKRTEKGRWLTTYCGDTIVQEINLELSNKYIDEYADKETINFWMANIQQITEQCKPVFEIFTLEFTAKHHKTNYSLNLPLRSGADESVDMFICHEFFLYL